MHAILEMLDFWDHITFAALFILGVFGVFRRGVLGLPGRIAIARNHPEAEVVSIMGWAGFLAIVPRIRAFMRAFKRTEIIDIRRFLRSRSWRC